MNTATTTLGSLLLRRWLEANDLTKEQFGERLKKSVHRGTAHQIIYGETGIKPAFFSEPVPETSDLDAFVEGHLKAADAEKSVNDLVDEAVGVDGWGQAGVIGGGSR